MIVTKPAPTLAHLIDVVSPWKLECAQQCLAKFFFRYVERDRDDAFRPEMQWGNAIDETGNDTYRAKQLAGRTPSAKDVQERFAAHWAWHSQAVPEWGDTSSGELLDRGAAGIALWRDRVAAWIEPAHAQEDITADVLDVVSGDRFSLRGIVDLRGKAIDDDGARVPVVADLKGSRRRYEEAAFARKFQPVAYSLLTQTPTFQYHVIVATKQVQTQVMSCNISNADRAGFLRRAAMLRRQVAHAFRTGDWLPNRSGYLCSRRYCPHWRRCEKAFGGRVAE